MATLEKIRSKSVFLIIVIGVALLAFIVGDALTNSRNLFGDNTTVAKIGGDKIDYTEYQRKREELNNELEQARKTNPQAANYDTQMLAQLAVDQLVVEHLLNNSIKNLGIEVSGEQLRYYMMDNPVNQNIGTLIQQMQQAGLNVSTPQQAYEVIFNPKRNGLTDADVAPMQRAWLALEAETSEMIKRNTYQRLLTNTIRPNELDKRGIYEDYVASSDITVAFKPLTEADTKKYKASDSEIKKLYDSEKEMYKLDEPTKIVSFLAVNITPSEADRKEASRLAQETATSLRDSASGLAKGARAKGVSLERKEQRVSDLRAGALKDYLVRAPKDSVSIINNDMSGFTVVRMGARKSVVDSIQVNTVAVSGATLPAKVLARINAGTPIDTLMSLYKDSVQVQQNQWIPLYSSNGSTNAIEPAMLDSLTNAGGKFIPLMKAPQGTLYAQLIKKNAPVEVVEYEQASYRLNPSTRTVTAERDKLQKFLTRNNDAAKFAEAARKAGYNVSETQLSQSVPAVPLFTGAQRFYPNSRQVVRWVVMDADKGDISHIYESKEANAPALYVAAVTDEYEEYVPYTDKNVRASLEYRVKNSKAGDAYVKAASGKASPEQAAAAIGAPVQRVPDFRFGSTAQVNDLKVMGRIAGSRPGTFKVVKGDDGVYIFRVNRTGRDKAQYMADSYMQQYIQRHRPAFEKMLKGNKKYENKVYKFEAGD